MTKIFDALIKAGGEAGRMVSRAVDRDAITAQQQVALIEGSIEVKALEPRSPALMPFGPEQRVAAEQYRFIRTRLAQDPSRPRVVAVSSGSQGDGKTSTAINLSAALSMKEATTVLLIDGDMRRGSVARELGLAGKPGLSDVLTGESTLSAALVRASQYPNLFILPAGEQTQNAPDLLDSAEWKSLCTAASQQFRYTIVDCPPVGPVADYDLIQAAVDKVLLVVRPDSTPRAACYAALRAVPASKLLGVVLNAVPEWPFNRQAGYYYQAGAYYAAPPEANEPSSAT